MKRSRLLPFTRILRGQVFDGHLRIINNDLLSEFRIYAFQHISNERAISRIGPEKLARVTKKYRVLAGEHSDHPGEGLGNGARQRLIDAA
jgi:hypothetical protein